MNVLIVDHSKVFRTLWERAVAALGYRTLNAGTGTEALALLQNEAVDVVLVAVSLHDMDAPTFCRQARANPRCKNLPIIAISSSQDQTLRTRCFEAGITDILGKTDLQAVVERVQKLAGGTQKQVSGRVLYVEDSSVVAHVMQKILRSMQLEVNHFKSAEEAFASFEKNDYDLIISDVLVEGSMSGIGLVNRIRDLEGDKSRIPILAISGLDDTARRIELFRLGINDFITKPVIKEEVIARVSNLITSKQLFDQVHAQQQRLYELAMLDPLTGLYNRNSLDEFAHKYFGEAARHDFPLSMLIIDLDNFKEINDQHGHLAGDAVLEQVGQLLKTHCRQEDFPARYGGDEFLIILTHCSLEDARQKAATLCTAIAALQPEGISITASIGVAARKPGEQPTLDELLHVADQAVYAAKQAGRNQSHVSDS